MDTKELSLFLKKKRVKLGFIWIILCSVIWGIGYVPMELVWNVDPFLNFGEYFTGTAGNLVSAVIIAATQALMFALVLLLVWTLVNGKGREFVRTFKKFKISKWYLLGCLCGGPCAWFGSTLAVGYVGASFAAAIALLCAVVGAVVGKVFYREKLSRKTVIGIILLMIGGIVVLNPMQMIEEITNPASPDGMWIGYLGGILSAIGWGVESNFVARGLDVSDGDSSVTIRYCWEAILWFILLIPIIAGIAGWDSFMAALVAAFTNWQFLFWMFMIALTIGIAEALYYKAFPLLGVGRSLSINALYVPVSLVALFIFLGDNPGLFIVVGTIVCVAGTFVMYWEKDSLTDSIRS